MMAAPVDWRAVLDQVEQNRLLAEADVESMSNQDVVKALRRAREAHYDLIRQWALDLARRADAAGQAEIAVRARAVKAQMELPDEPGGPPMP